MFNCCVESCQEPADYEVILYDFYTRLGHVFFQQDYTCPYICAVHARENELSAVGERKPGAVVSYRYTNRHASQGFNIYRPLQNKQQSIEIEQFPELMPYSPLIVDGKIHVSVSRSQFSKFAHKVRELNRRASDLGLQGLEVHAKEE